jgi:hypothetical protein
VLVRPRGESALPAENICYHVAPGLTGAVDHFPHVVEINIDYLYDQCIQKFDQHLQTTGRDYYVPD